MQASTEILCCRMAPAFSKSTLNEAVPSPLDPLGRLSQEQLLSMSLLPGTQSLDTPLCSLVPAPSIAPVTRIRGSEVHIQSILPCKRMFISHFQSDQSLSWCRICTGVFGRLVNDSRRNVGYSLVFSSSLSGCHLNTNRSSSSIPRNSAEVLCTYPSGKFMTKYRLNSCHVSPSISKKFSEIHNRRPISTSTSSSSFISRRSVSGEYSSNSARPPGKAQKSSVTALWSKT